MDTEAVVVYGVVGLILVTTLASGPLVQAVDLTPAPADGALGDGEATIGSVSLPATAEIASGRYGSGEHYLRVPDATLDVRAVSGRPLLSYEVSIPGLGYGRTTTHLITSSHTGTYELSLERVAIDSAAVEAGTYEGRLRVFLRANGTEQRLAARNITVEVTG